MRDKLCPTKGIKTSPKKDTSEISEELIRMVMTETLKGVEKTEKEFNLNEVETVMSEVLKEVRKRATVAVLEEQDVKTCECKCGKRMELKDRPTRTIIGLARYTIRRRLFYCDICKKYERPLDAKIGKSRYSLEVKQGMILLGPF